jgi:hypothetical protein
MGPAASWQSSVPKETSTRYPELVLANAALGEGLETHPFFHVLGFDVVTRSRMHDLRFTMLGDTARHIPQGLGGRAGMTAMATHRIRTWVAEAGVATSRGPSPRGSFRSPVPGGDDTGAAVAGGRASRGPR